MLRAQGAQNGNGLGSSGSRRRRRRLEDGLFKDESLRPRSVEPHNAGRDGNKRRRQRRHFARCGGREASAPARYALYRGILGAARLCQLRIADRARGVVAAVRAGAHVRGGLTERMRDPRQTVAGREHRHENRDEELQAEDRGAHRYTQRILGADAPLASRFPSWRRLEYRAIHRQRMPGPNGMRAVAQDRDLRTAQR
jgi:hypothetical protein